MLIYSKGCLKFCLVILEDCHTRWQNAENFMPAQNVVFWQQDRLAFCLWRWCLLLVLILSTDEFVWKVSWLMIMKLINESIYWHGIVRISSCLNRLLQAVSSTFIPCECGRDYNGETGRLLGVRWKEHKHNLEEEIVITCLWSRAQVWLDTCRHSMDWVQKKWPKSYVPTTLLVSPVWWNCLFGSLW